MNQINDLTRWFDDRGPAIIALSGGVDSALVAYAAYRALGPDATAVTADYQTLASEELESAKKICAEIGISHRIIRYSELDNADFVRNDSNRCFYCRSELAGRLADLARHTGSTTIADGTHADDLGDYRPGITALREGGISSPLLELGFGKDIIRRMARDAGLSVYDRPSNSCLASRIPWGQRVTSERLAQIEMAETFIRNLTGVGQLRVRHDNGSARVEVLQHQIGLLNHNIEQIRDRLHMIGFENVTIDPDGYRPGKINVVAD